jgi:1-acyl-sn-glycerol-3-phosphate acyltransferase
MIRRHVSTVLAAIRSTVAYLFVASWVLVVGTPALAVGIVTGAQRHLFYLGILCVRIALAIVGIRVMVVGANHLQRRRAALYCVNHASNVEPPILFAVLRELTPNLKVVYKAVLRKLPILGRGFDVVGFVPIERENRERATQAIEKGVDAVRAGNSLLMFPEGTRSRTGELLPFKRGAFVLAIKAAAPVVPVAIFGADRAMRKGSKLIWPTVVRVHLGAPVDTAGMHLDDRGALAESVRARVAELLEDAAEADRAGAGQGQTVQG